MDVAAGSFGPWAPLRSTGFFASASHLYVHGGGRHLTFAALCLAILFR